MNFELKTLDLGGAGNETCDALIVLLSAAFKPGKDALSALVAQVHKAGDLETKAGKSLQIYRPAGLACARLVLVSVGEGSVRELRQGVAGAVAAVKGSKVKKLVLCFSAEPQAEGLRASMTAVAEASYVFTTTKSKPEPRTLQLSLIHI